MAEFRYHGMSAAGRPVQGMLAASNKRAAHLKLAELMRAKRFSLSSLEKKRTYVYKVQKGTEKTVTAERKAYSPGELARALRAIGYRVISVRRKVLDFNMRPPTRDVVMFIRLGADLLREKLPYDEVLQLLGGDIQNKALRDAIKEISSDLKDGKEGKEVFAKQEVRLGVLGRTCLALRPQAGTWWRYTRALRSFWSGTRRSRRTLEARSSCQW